MSKFGPPKSGPQWLRRSAEEQRSPQQRGRDSERTTLKGLGVKLTAGSGATPWDKGDGYDDHFRYEHKETGKKRVPVDVHVLKKIWEEAIDSGRDPVVIISMLAMEGACPKQWVMVSADTWKELTDGS